MKPINLLALLFTIDRFCALLDSFRIGKSVMCNLTSRAYSAIVVPVLKRKMNLERIETMATRYKYERYLGDDFVESHLRVPRKLYEKACKASNEARQSFNKQVVELLEREFGSVEVETVVLEK